MPFDYKKEYKEFYLPPNTPEMITVPAMQYVAVRGQGNPNSENGDYQQALSLLYGVSFTVKMSYKTDHRMDGYFAYVVPPLEGFWWMEGVDGVDYGRKEAFHWISVIRLPEFVTEEAFNWAKAEAQRKKKQDFSRAEYLTVEEGLCVQCMHLGPFDDEPATVERMDAFIKAQGYVPDFSDTRLHHEIYLSDFRRCAPENYRTVIRHPVRKI